MRDVQNEPDYRNIPIDKVGIKNLRYPIKVLDRCNGYQHTVATINMYVDLPHRNKGTHMSRFVEILNQYRLELSLKKISDILAEMKTHLNAASAHIEITFPYFIEKSAPVSLATGLMDYACTIRDPAGRMARSTWFQKWPCRFLPFAPARKRSAHVALTISGARCR